MFDGWPLQESLGPDDINAMVESALELLGSIPLWLWILIGVTLVSILGDLLDTSKPEHSSSENSETRSREGPSRERYTIHDDIEDRNRTYRPPSESDPIETPNKVDRSILATIKRLVSLGGSTRDE